NTDFFANDMTSFRISVNGSDYVTVDLSEDGNLVGPSHSDIATEIAGRINASLATLSPAQQVTCAFTSNITGVGRFFSITAATPSTDNISVKIKRASSNDIAEAMMLGVEQGG